METRIDYDKKYEKVQLQIAFLEDFLKVFARKDLVKKAIESREAIKKFEGDFTTLDDTLNVQLFDIDANFTNQVKNAMKNQAYFEIEQEKGAQRKIKIDFLREKEIALAANDRSRFIFHCVIWEVHTRLAVESILWKAILPSDNNVEVMDEAVEQPAPEDEYELSVKIVNELVSKLQPFSLDFSFGYQLSGQTLEKVEELLKKLKSNRAIYFTKLSESKHGWESAISARSDVEKIFEQETTASALDINALERDVEELSKGPEQEDVSVEKQPKETAKNPFFSVLSGLEGFFKSESPRKSIKTPKIIKAFNGVKIQVEKDMLLYAYYWSFLLNNNEGYWNKTRGSTSGISELRDNVLKKFEEKNPDWKMMKPHSAAELIMHLRSVANPSVFNNKSAYETLTELRDKIGCVREGKDGKPIYDLEKLQADKERLIKFIATRKNIDRKTKDDLFLNEPYYAKNKEIFARIVEEKGGPAATPRKKI